MNAPHLAALTLESWRSSGARTEARRDALLVSYAESYYGAAAHWSAVVRAEVDAAALLLRSRTRIDELTYEK